MDQLEAGANATGNREFVPALRASQYAHPQEGAGRLLHASPPCCAVEGLEVVWPTGHVIRMGAGYLKAVFLALEATCCPRG